MTPVELAVAKRIAKEMVGASLWKLCGQKSKAVETIPETEEAREART